MKLALLTFDFPPDTGGVQNYLWELSKKISEKHDLTIISMKKRGMLQDDLSRLAVPSPKFWHFLNAIRRLAPEKLLIGHAHPQLLLAAKLSGRPYLVFTHGNDYLAAQKRWHRKFFNQWLKAAEPLVTTTVINAGKMRLLGLQNPLLVPPAVDPAKFFPAVAAGATKQSAHLLTVARLVNSKGVDSVLKAIPAIAEEFPAVQYTIIGEGPEENRLKRLAEAFGIAQRVRFEGCVVMPDLLPYYQKATIL